MMGEVLLPVASWWAAIEVMSLITLPLSSRILRNLPDRGYAFSKILGLLFFSYVMWLTASVRILPNHRLTMIFFLAAFATVFALWLRRHHQDIGKQLETSWPHILAVEIVFASTLVLWALLRSYSPAIAATEKPMDFAFLNATMRSDYMPPPDPWLSGFTLNYYYFGHFMVAALSKLTGVPSSVGFNLANALFFALAAVGMFSLVSSLVARSEGGTTSRKAIAFGLVGVLLLLIAGNLEGILELLYSQGKGSAEFWKWLNIKGLVQPYQSGHWYPTEHWWFWRATRVIDTVVDGQSLDYTITEFPFFSFFLADLHAHLLALPLVLVTLALIMNTLFAAEPVGASWTRRDPVGFVATVVAVGSLGVTDTIDLPLYLAVFVGVLFFKSYAVPGERSPRWWAGPTLVSVMLIAGAVFYYLPFYSSFHRPVSGIVPWFGPGTRTIHWLLLYGLFGFIILSVVILDSRSAGTRSPRQLQALLWLIPIVLIPLVEWTLIRMAVGALPLAPTAVLSPIVSRWRNLIPILVLELLLAWLLVTKAKHLKEGEQLNIAHLYALIVALTATSLLYGTELFYIKDVLFNNRINTIFRLHYQVWVLFAIASAYWLYRMHSKFTLHGATVVKVAQRIAFGAWWAAAVLLLASALYYPAGTLASHAKFSSKATLDGLAFLNAPEREAIEWLKSNSPPTAVIAEAYGTSYTDAGRIAQRTGIPTILSWAQHQTMLRGGDESFKERPGDIDKIFRSNNPDEVRALLSKYKVTFVYFGNLEQQQYGEPARAKFAGLASIAFRNEAATIFKVQDGGR